MGRQLGPALAAHVRHQRHLRYAAPRLHQGDGRSMSALDAMTSLRRGVDSSREGAGVQWRAIPLMNSNPVLVYFSCCDSEASQLVGDQCVGSKRREGVPSTRPGSGSNITTCCVGSICNVCSPKPNARAGNRREFPTSKDAALFTRRLQRPFIHVLSGPLVGFVDAIFQTDE